MGNLLKLHMLFLGQVTLNHTWVYEYTINLSNNPPIKVWFTVTWPKKQHVELQKVPHYIKENHHRPWLLTLCVCICQLTTPSAYQCNRFSKELQYITLQMSNPHWWCSRTWRPRLRACTQGSTPLPAGAPWQGVCTAGGTAHSGQGRSGTEHRKLLHQILLFKKKNMLFICN